MNKQPKTPLYVELPDLLYKQLKNTSHIQNRPMTQIVRDALNAYLSGFTILFKESSASSAGSTIPAPNGKPFSRFIEAWRGKTFQFALSQLGITDPDLQAIHAAAAGVQPSDKATIHDAYFYLLQRAEERGL